jgi:hypothetical protein
VWQERQVWRKKIVIVGAEGDRANERLALAGKALAGTNVAGWTPMLAALRGGQSQTFA